RTQESNRVHKVLDTANRTLGVVASTVVGLSGRRRLRAIDAGEAAPAVVAELAELAELAKGRRREQLPALREAVAGRPHARHRQRISDLLAHSADREQAAHRVEVSIAGRLAAQQRAVQLLLTLPATGPVTAAAILAEIGTAMARLWRGVPARRPSPR